jgi:hypothetical protein
VADAGKKKPACQGGASHGSLGVMASLLRDIPGVSEPPYWWRSHGQLKAGFSTENGARGGGGRWKSKKAPPVGAGQV